MIKNILANAKAKLWVKFLPYFIKNDDNAGDPYDYYAVYFADVNRCRYRLVRYNGRHATLEYLDPQPDDCELRNKFSLSQLLEMESEIVSYKKYGKITLNSIFVYAINHYLHLIDIKTFLLRGKGALVSTFFRERELKSRERVFLLGLIVNEFVKRRPSRPVAGLTIDEVIELLYGKLWYKHIRNEQFRYKVTLLIESLVLSGDLAVENQRYTVQGNAITTLVEFEKDERRSQQQDKMQRNMIRLMLVITVATVFITLALLGLAGVIDLHKIWQDILQIKPVCFLFKLI